MWSEKANNPEGIADQLGLDLDLDLFRVLTETCSFIHVYLSHGRKTSQKIICHKVIIICFPINLSVNFILLCHAHNKCHGN